MGGRVGALVAGTVLAVLATLDEAWPAFARFMSGLMVVLFAVAVLIFLVWVVVLWTGYSHRVNQEVRRARWENGDKARALAARHHAAVQAGRGLRADITVDTPERVGRPPGQLPPNVRPISDGRSDG